MLELNTVYNIDCLEGMKLIDDNSIDLIITSPPYAERRKKAYGGIAEEKYTEWFLPIAVQIKRILKPTGSFFLNIKPHTKNGERSLYVFELVIALKREIEFYYVDEISWIKNSYPGSLKGRFKNAFEPVYHFTTGNPNNIIFNPLACGTPVKEDSIKRANRKYCGLTKNESGLSGTNKGNMKNITIARPSNVLHIPNITNQYTDKKKHAAVFPDALASFFIKSFSNENATVLDPFGGSGTTGVQCIEHNRNFIIMEKEKKCYTIAQDRITDKLLFN